MRWGWWRPSSTSFKTDARSCSGSLLHIDIDLDLDLDLELTLTLVRSCTCTCSSSAEREKEAARTSSASAGSAAPASASAGADAKARDSQHGVSDGGRERDRSAGSTGSGAPGGAYDPAFDDEEEGLLTAQQKQWPSWYSDNFDGLPLINEM